MSKLIWNGWEQNFEDAKRFFNSKGNNVTLNNLKTKWYKNYCKNIKDMVINK